MDRKPVLFCVISLIVGGVILSLLSTGCAKNNPDLEGAGSSQYNSNSSFTQSVLILNQQLQAASNMYESSSSASLFYHYIYPYIITPVYAASAIGVAWTDQTKIKLINPETDGTGSTSHISLKKYMSEQFDVKSKRPNGSSTNMFGRIQDAYDIFCGLGLVMTIPSEGAYPANGDHNITLTTAIISAMTSQCNLRAPAEMVDGVTIPVNVSDPSNTTMFDKKVTVTIGPVPHVFYVRYNSTHIHVASLEKNSNGETRTVLLFDRSNKALKAE